MGKTQNPNLSLSRNMVVLFSTVGVLLLLGTCCYLISIVTIEYDPVWNQNIKEKCPDFFDTCDGDLQRFYADYTFSSFGQISYLCGAYCGIVFQYWYFEGLSQVKPPQKKSRVKKCLRMLILISISIPFQIALHKVPRACNPFVWTFLQNGIVNFLLLFILFGFTDALLLKIGLYDKNDVVKKK